MRPILPLLTLLTLLSLNAWARAPARELGLIKQGRGRGAMRTLRPQLEQQPNDPHLNTLAGLAYATEGQYTDALFHLERGNGTDLYPVAGLARHAEALRATGRGHDAAALHSERLFQPDMSEGDETTALVSMIQDYRSVRAYGAAWDTLYRGLVLRPNEPRLNAFAAELALDEGDIAGAEGFMALARPDSDATPPFRLLLVEARLALARQDALGTLDALDQKEHQRMAMPEAAALRALALLELGQPEQALEVLSRVNLASREDPVLLAALTRTQLALGETAQAEFTWAFLQSVAPGSPMFPEHVPGLSPEPSQTGSAPE